MNITNHANMRKQQRNIPNFAIEIIERYGRVTFAAGGAEKFFFGKKEKNKVIRELKKTIQMVERANGGTLIVANGKIITVYRS